MRTIPISAFSSFFPAVWRYMRHNGCQCRCCPYANRFKADYTTVMLIGSVEECKINPTFFPWSFHVVRFCERRVKFKLASPLYSDHPYNVFGRSDKTWTCGLLIPNQARYQLRYTPINIIMYKNWTWYLSAPQAVVLSVTLSSGYNGASNQSRTDMIFLPRDFKSLASAYFAILA